MPDPKTITNTDPRWNVIADDLFRRPVPGHAHALAFVEEFHLTVCGGVVWRPLHDPRKPATDLDLIAPTKAILRDAVLAVLAATEEASITYATTRFGGERLRWTKPLPGSLDIWMVPPALLMAFVAQLASGKRTLWTPSGIVLDLDPGVVPVEGVEPYNIPVPLTVPVTDPEC